MRFTLAAIGATAAIVTATLAAPQAHARFHAPGLSAPNPVEHVACRMVKESMGGGVTTRKVCDGAPAANANCPLVTKRIVKAGGEVVVKTRRQC